MERFISRNIRMVMLLQADAKQSFLVLSSLRTNVKQSPQSNRTDNFVVPPRNDDKNSILSTLQFLVKKSMITLLRANLKQSFIASTSLRTEVKQSLQSNETDYFVVPSRNDGILSSVFNKQILFNLI